MKTIIQIAITLFLLMGIHVEAQVRLTTNAPKTVVVGETFAIRYTLNTDAGSAKTSLTEANGIEILFGPTISRAKDTKIVNGEKTSEQTTTFSYTCRANKSGMINIPRLTVSTTSNSYQSEALQIQIIGDGKEQNEKPANKPVSVSVPTDGDIFVRIEPAHQSVYVNEGVVVTVKLYTQRNITGFGKMAFPSFEGFEAEAIGLSAQNMTQEQYGGKKYYTIILAQYLLFPRQAGAIEIGSGSYEIATTKKQKDGKSDDFFGREKHISDTLRVGNAAVSITALPFPQNIAGNIVPVTGNFNMKASVDETNIIEGDAVRLTIHIFGDGNAKLIPIHDFASADFRVLSQQIADSTDVSAKGIWSSRIIEHVLMPTHAGLLRIYVPELVCFVPHAKSYLVTDNYEIPIMVTASANKTTIQESGEGINPKKYLSESRSRILFYTALVSLILLIIIYSIKSNPQKKEGIAHQDQGKEEETKSSLEWHLPYIIGIFLLICCLVVLW